MLRRQREIRNGLLRIADGVLFALSFFLAYHLRSGGLIIDTWVFDFLALLGGTREIESFESFLPLALLTLPVSVVALGALGFYRRPLLPSRGETAWQLFKACTLVTIVLVLVMFLFKLQLSRAVIILFGGISFVVVLSKEELLRRYTESKFRRTQSQQRFILIGAEEDVRRLYDEVLSDANLDLQIVARLDVNQTTIEEFVHLLHEKSANRIILSAKHTYFGRVERLIQACELEGVEVWMLADFLHTEISRTILEDFNGHPMIVFRSTPDFSWQAVAKQCLDRAGSFVGLLLFAPVLLACALSIRLTSPGPIFYRQERSGLNGRPFTMYKFRTMETNAEQQRSELEALNEMEGPVFKLSEDPRVTPVGRFLRRRSFDELPQLYNVLRGDMSLVGPRPLPVDETLRFDDLAHRRRLSVKPGMTCLWQISGRNEVRDFKQWVRLDLEYIDNWSFWLDFKILLRTVPVVIWGTGAK